MIVDCHTHIRRSEALPGQPEIPEAINFYIVLAEPDDSGEDVNKKLSEYIDRNREKRVGFAFVDPTKDSISAKSLALISEKLGLKGAVLYCPDCGFHPAHSRAMEFYGSAQELGLPVFFHNAYPLKSDAVLDYAQPVLLDEVARAFPQLKIVIGTMGMPFVEQTLTMAAKHKNVYADLTVRPSRVWEVYNTIAAAYEHGVMDKLLFGSGFPFGDAKECIETLLGFNKLLADTNLPTVPRSDIQNIIERNTLEVLGIKN